MKTMPLVTAEVPAPSAPDLPEPEAPDQPEPGPAEAPQTDPKGPETPPEND